MSRTALGRFEGWKEKSPAVSRRALIMRRETESGDRRLPVVHGGDAAVDPRPLDLLVREGDLLVLGELHQVRVLVVRHPEADRRDVRVGQLDGEVLLLGARRARLPELKLPL